MIFITGANGLIGSFIVKKLLSQNHSIRALRRKNSDLSLIDDVAHQIEWIEGDVMDVSLLNKCLHNIDTVIHLAAIVSFLPSDKEMMYRVNIEGTANVVNASLNNNVRKFIHVSSIAALGRKKNSSYVDEKTFWENSSINTNYATTKHLSELEVWRGIEEGLNATIVNPSVVVGPGDWNSGSTKIFKYISEGNLFYSTGEMNFIDVRDVTEIIYRLISENKGQGERFILNSTKMTYKELFYNIADQFGKKRPTIESGPFLAEIAWRLELIKSYITRKSPLVTKETARLSRHSFTYDNSKISKLLNYEFIPPEDTLAWVCKELAQKYTIKN